MLVNLWTDPRLRRQHQISFSYRQSPEYTSGLNGQLTPDFPLFPLSLPVQNWPVQDFRHLPAFMSRLLRVTFRMIMKVPFLIFDVVILTRLFRRLAPDLVHINNGGYPAARSARAAAIAARLAGVKKVVMVVNNFAVGYTGPERWFDFPIDRLVVRAADRFVTGSQAAANRLRSVLALKSDQVQSIHNGIRSRAPIESAAQVRRRLGVDVHFDGVIIGVVALMEPRKGHRVLIEALAMLIKQEPLISQKIVVWLEGDGPLRGELESSVRLKHLSGLVHFIGKEKNIVDMMNALDILVLPSVESEDFPNVTLEAMALGKAVVASALAGTPEQIVQEETGLLVEPGNAEELAKALRRLIERPEWSRCLGANGQERFFSMFTADIAVKNYIDLYHSLKEGVK